MSSGVATTWTSRTTRGSPYEGAQEEGVVEEDHVQVVPITRSVPSAHYEITEAGLIVLSQKNSSATT
jgi:hypothetical protein